MTMTAISAIKDVKNKKTYLASDQMGSNGFTGDNYKTTKIFKNNTITFAICGSYRVGQILKNNLKLRNFKEKETVDEYVFDYLDIEVRKVLKDRKFLSENDGVETIKNSEIIFAIKNRIFVLQGDLAILEPEKDFITSGSGTYHQEASIYTQLKMNPKKDYREVLKDAIVYTSQIVLSVGGKPQVIEHKHDK